MWSKHGTFTVHLSCISVRFHYEKFIESQTESEILEDSCDSTDVAEHIHYLFKIHGSEQD